MYDPQDPRILKITDLDLKSIGNITIFVQIGFQKVLERWNDIRLAETPEYKDHIVLRGLNTLNVQVKD